MFRSVILSCMVLATSAYGDEIGHYDFTDGTANNQISSADALPDLIVSGVDIFGGMAIFDTDTDYLALPVTFGASPFTIYIDAAYDVYPYTRFAVSQSSASTNRSEYTDFVIRKFPGHSNQVTFYNTAGLNTSINNGRIDGARHRIAITYDGVSLGNFFDDVLITRTLSGVLPDIDGAEVRFGDRSLGDGIGATGTLYEIRVFNQALSQADLASSSAVPIDSETDLLHFDGRAWNEHGKFLAHYNLDFRLPESPGGVLSTAAVIEFELQGDLNLDSSEGSAFVISIPVGSLIDSQIPNLDGGWYWAFNPSGLKISQIHQSFAWNFPVSASQRNVIGKNNLFVLVRWPEVHKVGQIFIRLVIYDNRVELDESTPMLPNLLAGNPVLRIGPHEWKSQIRTVNFSSKRE